MPRTTRLHGHQEGRFFHGYYDCYCYLPLYVFCGRHLLAAKLRRSNIDASAGALDEVERIAAQIRARWPRVKIVLRANSGFARDELMSSCGGQRHLTTSSASPATTVWSARSPKILPRRRSRALAQVGLARRFADLAWRTLNSWSRERRVVAKAEHMHKGQQPVGWS